MRSAPAVLRAEPAIALTEDTVRKSFAAHRDRFDRDWPEQQHVDLVLRAQGAFQNDDFAAFREVFEALRTRWQVFRRAAHHWTPEKTYRVLKGLGDVPETEKFAGVTLSRLGDDDLRPLHDLLRKVAPIKTLASGGVSVVAISKFLHFFNPRLFVIVDDAVVWNRVMGHWWLWDSFERQRMAIDAALSPKPTDHYGASCDLGSYLAMLYWCRGLLAASPAVMPAFREHLGAEAQCEVGAAGTFEAVAVEWLLLGLVELPPEGVVQDVPQVRAAQGTAR